MPTPENNQQKIIWKNSKISLMNQLYHYRKTTNKKPLKNSRNKKAFQITHKTTTKQLKQNITSKNRI